MKKFLISLFIILLSIVGTACSSESVESETNTTILTVSAAASLKDVVEEISKQFQEEYPEIELRFNFGASGALKQQIEQGAPVDLFMSAAEDKYEELVDQDFIHIGDSIVTNELVLITAKNAPVDIEQLSDLTGNDVEKIVIGTPDVVPAGTYAEQTLNHEGIYQKIEQKLVLAKDVRQVLTYVETENVQAGFVYKTDAFSSEKVKIAVAIDSASHEQIKYPVGVLDRTEHKTEALLFFEYLKGEKVEELWQQFGFNVINN